jgi:hypothetical protein
MQNRGSNPGGAAIYGYHATKLKHLFRKNAEFLMEKYVESLISLEYDLPAVDQGQCAGVFTESQTRNAR